MIVSRRVAVLVSDPLPDRPLASLGIQLLAVATLAAVAAATLDYLRLAIYLLGH